MTLYYLKVVKCPQSFPTAMKYSQSFSKVVNIIKVSIMKWHFLSFPKVVKCQQSFHIAMKYPQSFTKVAKYPQSFLN